MFMHGGLLHIGSNMLYLAIFGNNVEDRLGHARFLFFYLACGFLAAMAHVLSAPYSTVPTLGASGAVPGSSGRTSSLPPRPGDMPHLSSCFFITTVELPAVIVLVSGLQGRL